MDDEPVLDKYIRSEKGQRAYAKELIKAQLALKFADLLFNKDKDQIAYNAKLKKSKINKLLKCESNPRIGTLARLANAMGYELTVGLNKRR